ncbi:MAG: ATP-NAD kinase [Methanocalculus sp. MSAO_Arc1]|uniref:ATP-NAD kinase family protein n=1 Tax=Methanocalculus TaxID=71151 RepID=UPI000FEF237C|nr:MULTISPECIES: ATP-NAD kinase family protein [unclassified Methanocalculus]MCP1662873.1 putative polyphosphate/ATP-dependent NAD kinase [Methanocalculus sp. AMF5]RQD82071.1 MAG: ATP-NAD kinase [Methanocalculus sp. MSAO_Arc1]
MVSVGLVINPIAGLGGTVGLKGTDGLSLEALRRGATPRSCRRAAEALSYLGKTKTRFLTASGPMGEDAMLAAGITGYTIHYHCGNQTTATDTEAACVAIRDAGADLLVFAGGDGTARDVVAAVGTTIPILGIPAGVKMYSAVFATDPAAAAALIRDAGRLPVRDAEVLDVDETAYREGRLSTTLYGIARTPYRPGYVQHAKETFRGAKNDADDQQDIAGFMAGVLASGRPFILGPGSTTTAIAGAMALPKTLLGFDAYAGGRLVISDGDAHALREFLDDHPDTRLIISPIGSQGFIIGRGTQVITPDNLQVIGHDNIIVVATPGKLRATPDLHIDTGDRDLDRTFPDTIRVICGYGLAERRKIRIHGQDPGT